MDVVLRTDSQVIVANENCEQLRRLRDLNASENDGDSNYRREDGRFCQL